MELLFRYSGLQMVGAGSFDGLTSLNIMNIRHNNLSVIADGSFDNLLHLKILNLERNNNLKVCVPKIYSVYQVQAKPGAVQQAMF